MIKKKRNAFLAGLLNVVSLGLGFVYVGRLSYAIVLTIFAPASVLLLSRTKLLFVPGGVDALILGGVVPWIGSIAWASILARRQGEVLLKRYQRWHVYIVLFVFSTLAFNYLFDHRGMILGYESYRMPSSSMLPTLRGGDCILVDTTTYGSRPPSRG